MINISNSIIVKEGQNVTLACHGFGFPAPIITWSDAWNQVMENGHILQLPKINRNMAGKYGCTASNSCGTDSRKVDIDVRCEFVSAMKRILQATICTSWAPIYHIYLSTSFILCWKGERSLLCGMHCPIVCYITQNFSHVDGFCCVLPVCALNEEDHCIIHQREEERGGLLLVPIHVSLS